MIDKKTIGNRIKYFRTKAGLSQMDVEVQAEMSFGALSRLERGVTNPTKETINKISNILNLNILETSYIHGKLATPNSKDDSVNAVKSVTKYYKQKMVFSYLIDNRNRIVAVSEGFKSVFLKLIPQDFKRIGEITVQEILLNNPELFPPDKYKNILKYQLTSFKFRMGFMVDDEVYKNVLNSIYKNKIAKEIWLSIDDLKFENLGTVESKTITISLNLAQIELRYIDESLITDPNYTIVDYIPTNNLLREVQKQVTNKLTYEQLS